MNFKPVGEYFLVLTTRLPTICPKNKLGDPEDISNFRSIRLAHVLGPPLVLIHLHFQRNNMVCYWPISVRLQACCSGRTHEANPHNPYRLIEH